MPSIAGDPTRQQPKDSITLFVITGGSHLAGLGLFSNRIQVFRIVPRGFGRPH